MQRGKKLKAWLKKRIINESNEDRCNIGELAKTYKIRSGLLYKWRAEYKQTLNKIGAESASNSGGSGGQFVEITVNESSNCHRPIESLRLEEVSLVYNELTISITGKHSHKILPRILEILAAVTC